MTFFRRFPAFVAALAMGASAAFAAPAPARQFENLDRLDSIVAMTVGANIGEPGGPAAPVDRRLRLAACPQMPSVEGPVFGAAIVRCDSLGWRIRVPLAPGGAAQAAAPAGGARTGRDAPREMLIRKGDPVQLVAGNGSFSVTRPVVAEEDGAVGDMIRVREDRRSPLIIARVEAMGVVRIPTI